MSKGFNLLLILTLTISILIMVKPACAQSIPKPSVPEFTLKYGPAIPSNIAAQLPSVCNWNTINVIIKNENFTTIFGTNSNSTVSLYYHVQVKNHNSDNWVDVYTGNNYPIQSNNYFTYGSAPGNSLNLTYTLVTMPSILPENLTAGDQADVRVQAIIENLTELNIPQPMPSWFVSTWGEPLTTPEWTTLATSDWSNTQTITIGQTSASSSTSPASTSTVPEFPTNTVPDTDAIPISTILNGVTFVVVIVLIVVISLLLYIRHRKITNLKQ